MAGPAQTAVLNTALRLGVVDALEAGQKTTAELAQQCQLKPHAVQCLMQTLCSTGMTEQFDEYYALSQAGRLASKALWSIVFDNWTGLEAAVRQEDPAVQEQTDQQQQIRQRRFDQFKAIHTQVQWAATGVALNACEALGIGGERQSMRILDIGCGSAVYSMAFAHRDHAATLVLVDDAVGLARAQTTVSSLQAEDRVTSVESAELVFPGENESFDLVLISDRIHLLQPDVRQRVIATAMRVLKPGGELAIIDVFAGQAEGNLNVHLFELQLLVGTGDSLLTLETAKELLDAAGFQSIQYTHLPVAPHTHGLVLAAKP